MLILFVLFMLMLLEKVRRDERETLVLEYQFRLFALRDELRDYAVASPEATKHNWLFPYLDSLISRLIESVPDLNLWYAIGVALTYGNDERIKRQQEHAAREYAKPQNHFYRELEAKLVRSCVEFITKRHPILVASSAVLLKASLLPISAAVHLADGARRLRKKSLKLIVGVPEAAGPIEVGMAS